MLPRLTCTFQPPSGGCVLKLNRLAHTVNITQSAAFGRLCVETMEAPDTEVKVQSQPPSGGCVLKHGVALVIMNVIGQPPSGGCVLKPLPLPLIKPLPNSAAFGRLCVETPPHWH